MFSRPYGTIASDPEFPALEAPGYFRTPLRGWRFKITNSSVHFHRLFFPDEAIPCHISLLRGWMHGPPHTHGLRRGLYSFALRSFPKNPALRGAFITRKKLVAGTTARAQVCRGGRIRPPWLAGQLVFLCTATARPSAAPDECVRGYMIYTSNSTSVAPPPPSFWGASITDDTWGCFCSN